MMSHTQFQISQLRMTNQQKVLEAILALLAAIFVTALLPSLLLQYLYADTVLTEAPPLLEYLPVISFSAGVLYVIYVIASNMARSKRISELENEMLLSDGDVTTDEAELKELEALVDEALASQASEKSAAKKKTKSTKKTASKKKSKK